MKQGPLPLADGNKASLSKMKQHLRKEDRLAANKAELPFKLTTSYPTKQLSAAKMSSS